MGASCRSSAYTFRLTICQFRYCSTIRPDQWAKLATSRGRSFHGSSCLAGPPAFAIGLPPLSFVSAPPPPLSYSSLFITTGARPRTRNRVAKTVSGMALGLWTPSALPHDPSLFWFLTSASAPTLYQSVVPKYLRPLATPIRSTPYRP